MERKYDYIIWDFNGTLYDDLEVCLDCLNAMLERRGMRTLTVKEYQRVFGFPIKNYYERVGFDFTKESYENGIAPEWFNEYITRSVKCKTNSGVEKMLKLAKEKGISQIVLSVSDEKMLKKQLKGLGIEQYFDDVRGIDNIHGGGKVEIALDWRKKHKNGKILFIGDTEHDFEVAKAIDADCVLVTFGHKDRESLEKCGCPVVDSLDEIDI